jgi:DNA invertase Pin-like site-specific DNA recombinase
MPRVLGYARVSSVMQAVGSSLRDQQAAIETYAAARELTVAHHYVEAESAVRENYEHREQMQALLASVQRGDLVLVDKVDRWSRDAEFTYRSVREVLARGARWYAIADAIDPSTSDGDTALSFRILFAREEHKRIKERMVGTRQKLRAAGLYAEGLAPYGYRRRSPKGTRDPMKNALVVVEREAAIVREAFALAIAGRSITAIAEALPVTRNVVATLLGRRIYTGEHEVTPGVWAPAQWPAIIDADTWARARQAIEARRLGGVRSRDGERTAGWVLRDVATCALCGSRMASAWSGRNDYYRCGAPCSPRHVRRDAVEAAATPLVLARLYELRAELAREPESAPRIVDQTDARVRLARRRARYLEAYADEAMSRDELRAALARVDAELHRLAAAVPVESPLRRPDVRRDALAAVDVLQRAWTLATGPERRAIVRELAERVTFAHGVEPVAVWRSAAALVGRVG